MFISGIDVSYGQFQKGNKLPPRKSNDAGNKKLHNWAKKPIRSQNEYLCTIVDPLPPDSSLTVLFNNNYGFTVGTNAYVDKQKANFYDLSFLEFTELTDVLFTAYVDVPDSSKTVTLRVFDGTSGSPGASLGSAPVTLRQLADSFAAKAYVDIEFTTPIPLPTSKKIFISVDFSNLSIFQGSDEYFGLVSTDFGMPFNLAWEQWEDDSWHAFDESNSWDDSVVIELYPVVCGDIVAPVKLNKFSANQFGAANTLEWTTETESGNKGFEIQRSEDGINFINIGFVSSKANGGNSSSTIFYSYVDNSPTSGSNFYRVKQIDINSKISISKTLLVVRDKFSKGGILGIYPNPAKNDLNLIFNLPADKSNIISITDLAGRTLMQKQVEGSNTNQNIRLNISSLSKGTYFVSSGETNNMIKFVKE